LSEDLPELSLYTVGSCSIVLDARKSGRALERQAVVSVVHIHFNRFLIGFRLPAGEQKEVGNCVPQHFLFRDH
jgi:hypothetical protein